MKSYKDLQEFIEYSLSHPELRFFQALCSWIGCSNITVGLNGIDVFYIEAVDSLRDKIKNEKQKS